LITEIIRVNTIWCATYRRARRHENGEVGEVVARALRLCVASGNQLAAVRQERPENT